ncbi:MAG: transcriptional regulator [Legionellaceae bacterium]|nr:transcriptional regulator [Legionellaceae bacterium]
MSLQVINSILGQPEYVLLPVGIYHELRELIENKLKKELESEYVPFVLEDYISNPVALARIKASVTQEELADFMGVTQAYISKIERQKKITGKALEKVHIALTKMHKQKK